MAAFWICLMRSKQVNQNNDLKVAEKCSGIRSTKQSFDLMLISKLSLLFNGAIMYNSNDIWQQSLCALSLKSIETLSFCYLLIWVFTKAHRTCALTLTFHMLAVLKWSFMCQFCNPPLQVMHSCCFSSEFWYCYSMITQYEWVEDDLSLWIKPVGGTIFMCCFYWLLGNVMIPSTGLCVPQSRESSF